MIILKAKILSTRRFFFLVLLVSQILVLGLSPGTLVQRAARTFWHTAIASPPSIYLSLNILSALMPWTKQPHCHWLILHHRGIIVCASLMARFDTGRMFLRWHRKSGPTYKPLFRTLRTCLRQRATQRAPVLTSISGGWHCLVNQSIQICPPNEAVGSDNALIRWLIAIENLVWLQSSQATGFCGASMLWTSDEFHPAAFVLRWSLFIVHRIFAL